MIERDVDRHGLPVDLARTDPLAVNRENGVPGSEARSLRGAVWDDLLHREVIAEDEGQALRLRALHVAVDEHREEGDKRRGAGEDPPWGRSSRHDVLTAETLRRANEAHVL